MFFRLLLPIKSVFFPCIDFLWFLVWQNFRGGEWSLRAFASMRARAEIKSLLCQQRAVLESTTRERRALLYFPLAAIHMEILFFKIKQKIFLKDDVILIAKFKEISGPFILGKLAQNLKRTSSKVKRHTCTQAIPKIV